MQKSRVLTRPGVAARLNERPKLAAVSPKSIVLAHEVLSLKVRPAFNNMLAT